MIFKSLKPWPILFLVVFPHACSQTDIPENLIPEELMIDVLTETHLLEARVGRFNVNTYDSASVAFIYLQKELWNKYDIDSLSYVQSYDYYGKYPKKFKEIYQKVEDGLTKMEEEINGINRSENE
ncbi:MAG: hypothetical protein ACI9QN_002197 [Arcticibacterium sp.]